MSKIRSKSIAVLEEFNMAIHFIGGHHTVNQYKHFYYLTDRTHSLELTFSSR